MMTIEFDPAAVGMGVVIIPTFGHKHPFVEFVKQNIGVFGRIKIVVEPDFLFRHPRIDEMVATVDKINKEGAANQAAIDEPDDQTSGGFAQFLEVDFLGMGVFLLIKYLVFSPGFRRLGRLDFVGFGDGPVVIPSFL